MKLFMKLAMLLLLTAICTSFAFAQDKSNSTKKADEVFSEKNLELEVKKLKQMKVADKIKVRRAIEDLTDALFTASASNDTEEIAGLINDAQRTMEIAVEVIPDGGLKGSLIACHKALQHSQFLRLVSAGDLDPKDQEIAKILEEIIIRYRIAKIPNYERPAKILDSAEFFLETTKIIASEAGIVEKTSEK
jgi:hypothetical protein